MRDFRHAPIQHLMKQNHFGTGEDKAIEKEVVKDC